MTIEVIEIDSPSQAFFESKNLKRELTRYEYITLALRGDNAPLLVLTMENTINAIRDELILKSEFTPIIFWRKRPELSSDMPSGMFTIYCRLQTEPVLSEDFLKKFKVDEGEKIPVL